jgi:hypothetical protein
MVKKHKHIGVTKGNGVLRLHPITQKHKDEKASRAHELELQGVSSNPKLLKKLLKNSVDVTNTPKRESSLKTTNATSKPVEYSPIIPDSNIIVKFNKQQLEDMLDKLKKSGAQEIGISVKTI